jgi:protein farnesyltransferase/geranylgeranyltransferase type-1 subunit alpha
MERLYRASTLFALKADLREELDWLNTIALTFLKNYQIWQHRQMVVDKLGAWEGEQAFLARMFEKDTKNYHVWSYRQWLVRRFDLFDDQQEMQAVEDLLQQDIRNNSAWNHRWFLVFGKEDTRNVEKSVIDREIE